MRKLLDIPFVLWILIAAGLGYKDYYEWNTTVNIPLDATKVQKEAELVSVRKQAEQIEEFKKKKEEKLALLQELGEKFKATADKLPRTSSIPDLLKGLADISDKSGLQFSRFRPGTERKDQFLVVTPLDVTVKGTYVQIMTFLDAAAHMTRVVATEKIDMDNPQTKGPVNILGVTASMVTYHIVDVEAASK